ncbi:hypothetical protein PVAND_008343 [Polypedilum vanderplanki]|uniref:Secreted peptide n=1 Tax=Polypedilum vanderplanki TaxID=319348 RepID=A0A9J6CAQ9_POLVA|nr:hypothetical protein PVAND_008343 [Polypedilum vanderplanki]
MVMMTLLSPASVCMYIILAYPGERPIPRPIVGLPPQYRPQQQQQQPTSNDGIISSLTNGLSSFVNSIFG